jgi:hypothetical protein
MLILIALSLVKTCLPPIPDTSISCMHVYDIYTIRVVTTNGSYRDCRYCFATHAMYFNCNIEGKLEHDALRVIWDEMMRARHADVLAVTFTAYHLFTLFTDRSIDYNKYARDVLVLLLT